MGTMSGVVNVCELKAGTTMQIVQKPGVKLNSLRKIKSNAIGFIFFLILKNIHA